MDQLTLTLVIVCSALAGIGLSLLWLRHERSSDSFDQLARTARRRTRRSSLAEEPPTPPPPTPDLVAIQEMWKASAEENAEDPDTAWSSPGRHTGHPVEILAEPPTFPSSPGMKAFLEEEIASLPPAKRQPVRPGLPYPEAAGTADDYVRATQGVVLRSDRGPHLAAEDTDE